MIDQSSVDLIDQSGVDLIDQLSEEGLRRPEELDIFGILGPKYPEL